MKNAIEIVRGYDEYFKLDWNKVKSVEKFVIPLTSNSEPQWKVSYKEPITSSYSEILKETFGVH